MQRLLVAGSSNAAILHILLSAALHSIPSFPLLLISVVVISPLCYHHPFVLSLWPLQTRADLAASFQRTAIAHLTQRCRRAIAWAKDSHPEVQTMVVAGGVACNQMLRDSLEELTQEADLQLVCPKPRLCTDNGVMVAWAGVERSACISGLVGYSLSKSMLAEGTEILDYPCACLTSHLTHNFQHGVLL